MKSHDLTPVPVDLDMSTLEVKEESLARGLTRRTRAILVAHLFGSRMNLETVFELATRKGLPAWEDCAQAYIGSRFNGDLLCDVRMFSFGPIKIETALGGAILQFKNPALCERLRSRMASYEVQTRAQYFRRVCKFIVVKMILHPQPMAILFKVYRAKRTVPMMRSWPE